MDVITKVSFVSWLLHSSYRLPVLYVMVSKYFLFPVAPFYTWLIPNVSRWPAVILHFIVSVRKSKASKRLIKLHFIPLNSMTVIDIGLRDIRLRPRCEIVAVLGCFAAYIVSLLHTLRDDLSGPSSRVILRCTVMSKMCGLQPTLSAAYRLPL